MRELVNIHTPAALEGEYQSLSESTKISSKSRREVNNIKDQSTEHRDVDSVTEHKQQINVKEE